MNQKLMCLLGFLLSAVVSAQGKMNPVKEDQAFLARQPEGLYAKFVTNRGNVYAALEYKRTPMTVANFVGLAEGKILNAVRETPRRFYDTLKFHRVIPQFMIQSGCPKGNGTGGPGYYFADETDSTLLHDKPGILSMANSDPLNSKLPFGNTGMTNGSQFFITHVAAPWLDGRHTVFGHVVKGQEVINKIRGEEIDQRTGALLTGYGTGKPSRADTLKRIIILRKGREAQTFDAAKIFETEKTRHAELIAHRDKAENDKRTIENALALKRFENARVTPGGVKYLIEKEGSGDHPKPTDQITIYYRGTFTSGREFDSNIGKEPATLTLNQFIPGWVEGIQTMKPGGRSLFYVPFQLAYGEKGHPSGIIPPKSDLIFEIELVKVN